jgi:hypothetical protein
MYGREERNIQGFSGGKPEGKGPLGRPRRRLEDNIKMDLGKWYAGAWTRLFWFCVGTGGGLL